MYLMINLSSGKGNGTEQVKRTIFQEDSGVKGAEGQGEVCSGRN